MNGKPRISIMNSWTPTGTHDVFSGYVKAFRLLGYVTNAILSHGMYRDWNEYLRFFSITNGVPDWSYSPEDVVKHASFNAVIRVMESDPDVLIIIDGTSVHREAWEWLRRLGIPTIIVGTESPYQDKFLMHAAKFATKVFVNDILSAQKSGYDYLPVGYDSEVHHPTVVDTSYRHDVVFVGSGFKERQELLEAVDWDGIDFELYGYYRFDHDHKLAPFYKDEKIKNALTSFLYNGSKISLNLNRISVDYDGEAIIPEAQSLSPRVYEIAANGGFLISEWRQEIDDLFDGVVPTFKTGEELNDLIHYWLDESRDDKRARICAHLAVIARKHSYIERAKVVLKYINEQLNL